MNRYAQFSYSFCNKRHGGRRALLAYVAVIVAALSSCGEDSTAEEVAAAMIAQTCSLNSDCADPLVCAFERCHTECQETRDCPRDSRCVASGKDGVFICQLEDEATCSDDDDCPGKQRCAEDLICRGGCSMDDDCPEKQRCIDSEVGLVCADPEDLDGDVLVAPGNDDDTDDSTDDATDDSTDDDTDDSTDDSTDDTDDSSDDDPKGMDGGAGPGDGGKDSPDVTDQAQVVFTANGGKWDGLGVEFDVPKDAVDDDTDVTIVRVDVDESLPAEWTPLGGVFTVSGSIDVNVAITVRIPYESSAAGEPGLAYRPAGGKVWEIVDADFEKDDGFAVAERTDVSGDYVVVAQEPSEEFDCSVCGDTQICQFDRCYDQCDGTNPCDDGQACCDGLCADIKSDANNCGGCDVVCEADDNSTLTCSSGFCEVASCEEPFDDCDGNPENGCEADLTSDVRHCGGCGNGCGVGAECVDSNCETSLQSIHAGERSTCLLRSNGKVLCWGSVAGAGNTGYSPRVVSALGPVLDITSAGSRAYAVLESGRVVSFSSAEWDAPVAEPVTDGVAIDSSGVNNTCVLRESGLVSCWGTNAYGEAGVGMTGAVDTPTTVSGLNDAIQISLGQLHACALHQGGAPTCWGYNGQGRLGDGETGSASAPRPVVITAGSSEAYQDFEQIAAGSSHTCALRVNGDVLCWGYNTSQQLGTEYPETTQSLVPVIVEGLSGVVSVHSSPYATHTCALHDDGTVSCWGGNAYGQLGRDEVDNAGGAPAKVKGLSGVTALSVGGSHTCALRTDAAPVCWGYNGYGQLGDASATQRTSPVPVANLP